MADEVAYWNQMYTNACHEAARHDEIHALRMETIKREQQAVTEFWGLAIARERRLSVVKINQPAAYPQETSDAAQVCPEAEPERPAEPVSERCQWYGHDGEGPQCDRAATTWRKSAMYPDGRPLCAEHRAIMDREYRSDACGGSDCSSSGSCGSGTVSVEPTPKNSTAAPAADPRLWYGVFVTTSKEPEQPVALFEYAGWAADWAKQNYPGRSEVRADAQFEKAGKPVTISEAEALQITGWSDHTSRQSDRARAICALLRSKGVEVVP